MTPSYYHSMFILQLLLAEMPTPSTAVSDLCGSQGDTPHAPWFQQERAVHLSHWRISFANDFDRELCLQLGRLDEHAIDSVAVHPSDPAIQFAQVFARQKVSPALSDNIG